MPEDQERVDTKLDAIVENHPEVFRHATLKEGKRGLKKLVP